MQPHRTAMTAVDRSWLRMESVENPMMISAVLCFEQAIPMKRLKRLLTDRFLSYRRFRQRVVTQGDRTYWEDDPLFNIDNHIHHIALPGSGNQNDLQELVSDLNSTALDFNRPLWQLHYIEHYNGGCALLVRIHHCIADGISLVRVLLSLTDNTPEPKVHTLTPLRPAAHPQTSSWRQSIDRIRNSGHAALEQARLFLQSVEKDPGYPLKLAATASDVAVDCIKLGFAREEPDTSLKRPLSGRKQVAWAEPLDLSEVKRCARILKGTVNDVLLSVASGALHKHFKDTGEPIPDCGIRVAVPFNLRPLNRPIADLGNQFGLVLVPLPVDVHCPVMRFRQTRENMNRLKRSYQAQVTYSLLDLFGRGPDMLERRALNMLSHKASAVLTNVPGPKEPVYLAGVKLAQPMFWVPQSGNIGIGMSIFSYANTVQFGITVDRSIPADPQAIMDHFHESFDQLLALAGRPPEQRMTLVAG
ncbi:WS/DGAT/MGAT family O-acyltransferase [Marinobacter mobilis]|uniref:diacylglycerol O-acyltransferase n=1 Tax=Marinobacter mobilis TaxID=488533 RepID=A0A1H2QLX3_9GAMM|nr:wax ester/triacylglycerol synthase family O-acyltransferase [Marinobacter mobilis]SDW07429.1 acyltransferase, WS/DGAT/MGAT [Marinobacter mobilis]